MLIILWLNNFAYLQETSSHLPPPQRWESVCHALQNSIIEWIIYNTPFETLPLESTTNVQRILSCRVAPQRLLRKTGNIEILNTIFNVLSHERLFITHLKRINTVNKICRHGSGKISAAKYIRQTSPVTWSHKYDLHKIDWERFPFIFVTEYGCVSESINTWKLNFQKFRCCWHMTSIKPFWWFKAFLVVTVKS